MTIAGILCSGGVLICCGVSATAGPLNLSTQEVASTPIQALTSPGVLSAVEENSDLAPHGNDRHYTNGLKLSYTTGPLGEKAIWNAPIRWLGESAFLFHSPDARNR